MNRHELARAGYLAGQLEDRIEELLRAMEAKKDIPFVRFPKESGAVRRTSMELTRALADLRRIK